MITEESNSSEKIMQRKVMQFLLPISAESIKTFGSQNRQIVPLYLNPTSFRYNVQKVQKIDKTKGGFFFQYYGNDLPTISIQGTTGSAGIEGINILHKIFNHEKIRFTQDLMDYIKVSNEDVLSTIGGIATATRSEGISLDGVLDSIGGAVSNGWNNLRRGIASIGEAYADAVNQVTNESKAFSTFVTSIAAYQTSLDIYFQGVYYRGYLERFDFSETNNSPGHFTYGFSFKVLFEFGERVNFMPWHRHPYDSSGNPTTALGPMSKLKNSDRNNYSVPIAGPRFVAPNTEGAFVPGGEIRDQDLEDGENVPLNR